MFFAISVREASLLIAIDNDSRDQSELESELPNDGDWAPGTSPLLEPKGKLKSVRDQFEKGILKALDSGRIKPVVAARNSEDRLDPIYTLLSSVDVKAWCDEHDVGLGDWWDRYELDEHEFATAVAEDIVAHRMPSPIEVEPTETGQAALTEYFEAEEDRRDQMFRKVVAELESLKNKRDVDRVQREGPLNTRARNSLLSVIAALVGALEDRLPEGYKRAQAVAVLTDQVGASVSVNTVNDILKEAAATADRKRKAT
ncbi:hypothetical protein LMG27177_01177 [Paraburkholderia fynbosensis]|uniref:Uncharacterized protein n=2 Tax=Paraburkholderia fynbosensis TaxID=1200993 RepID=A0A6J5FNS6_9BURK|nr:hypothetical protein LMG27177_01177 [Paraburkholderia fynbosensis]